MKKFLMAGALALAFMVGACSPVQDVIAEQTRPLKIWFENENGGYETLCVVDEETGVNYIVVSKYRHESGIAITPRLNEDGSLYVSR